MGCSSLKSTGRFQLALVGPVLVARDQNDENLGNYAESFQRALLAYLFVLLRLHLHVICKCSPVSVGNFMLFCFHMVTDQL